MRCGHYIIKAEKDRFEILEKEKQPKEGCLIKLNRKQVIQVLSQGWVSEDLFCEVSVRNLVVHSNSDDVDDFLRTF